MGNVLDCEMIIPEEWYLNFSKSQIFDEIENKIEFLQKNNLELEEAEFEIGEIKTTLMILDFELCWCFIRVNESSFNASNYYFSGNLLIEMFPHFHQIYTLNQQRRSLQILSANFLNNNLNDDD